MSSPAPFSYCHACGAAYTGTTWPRTCAACGTVHYRNPLPVSVAVIPVLGFPSPRVLVVRRAIAPFIGEWALPGGFMEANTESAEQAAQRETFEETGLKLDPNQFQLGHSAATPHGQVLLFCLGPVLHADSLSQAVCSEEVQEVHALALTDEMPLCFSLHREAIERYREEIEAFWLADQIGPLTSSGS